MPIETDAFPLCIRTQNDYKYIYICLYIKINDLALKDPTKNNFSEGQRQNKINSVTSQF